MLHALYQRKVFNEQTKGLEQTLLSLYKHKRDMDADDPRKREDALNKLYKERHSLETSERDTGSDNQREIEELTQKIEGLKQSK